MSRRAKTPKGKTEAKRARARKSPNTSPAKFQELERRLAEALEERAALSEILRVISHSPTDLQPVFDAIVASSVRLCGAKFGGIFPFDGEMIRFAAHHNLESVALATYHDFWPRRPEPNQLIGTVILDRRVLHIHDVAADPRFTVAFSLRDEIAIRSFLGVPMLRGAEPIGVIGLYRDKVVPFTNRQIDLVKTFAAQAVIAIENVRLFNETTDALERQTATSDISG